MLRPLTVLTATAAIVAGTCSVGGATTKIAVNPELVNPVVVSSALVTGTIAPAIDPTGVVQAESFQIPSSFWVVPSGPVPIFSTPPAEPPEIIIADVQQRMSILYVTDPAAKAILNGSSGMRSLPWLFRQEPSNSAGDAALAGGGSQRMTKVSGRGLAAKKSADGMKAMLKAAVNRTCVTPAGVNTCGARLVGVDEIGASFGTEAGESDANTPGQRLKTAMTALAKEEFAPGQSFASRIHFYVAPGVSTSISAGLGPKRNLGADGKEKRRDYSEVMAAMSRAGGVWLEMYHYPSPGKPRTPFTASEWRDVPTRFAAFLRERSPSQRNPLNYLHFVLTETAGKDTPAGEPCRITPVGSKSSNSNFVVDNIISVLPPCPIEPATCAVARPAGSSNEQPAITWQKPRAVRAQGSHSVGPRRFTVIPNLADGSLISTAINGGLSLAINDPSPSGMLCQWQRAQIGDVNTRILANGPSAFKVTGTEAAVFGQQFRQFFIVG